MPQETIQIPVIDIDGEKWLLLKHLDEKIVFRADSIQKLNQRVSDPSGHRMDQAVAEGSVKCKPKRYVIK